MSKDLFRRMIGTNDLRGVGHRLGYWLPLCPWPVFLWIQSQDEYMWSSRHSAEPMYAVGNQARLAVILLTTMGAALGLSCAKNTEQRGFVFAFLVAHFWIILQWVVANAVAYA